MANTKSRKRGRAPATVEVDKAPEPSVLDQPPPKSPADQPVEVLRRYIRRYNLQVASPMTFQGFLLGGGVGKYSHTSRHQHRITRDLAVRAMEDHLRAGVIREAEAISEFIYASEHKNEEYKLQFGETSREKAPDVEKSS